MSALARLAVYENLLIRQEISVHCLYLSVLVLCGFQKISYRPEGTFPLDFPLPTIFIPGGACQRARSDWRPLLEISVDIHCLIQNGFSFRDSFKR